MSRYFKAVQGVQSVIGSGGWPAPKSLRLIELARPLDGSPKDLRRPWSIAISAHDLQSRESGPRSARSLIDGLFYRDSIISFLGLSVAISNVLVEAATPKCPICGVLSHSVGIDKAIENIKSRAKGTLVIALQPLDDKFINLSLDEALQYCGGSSVVKAGQRVTGSELAALKGSQLQEHHDLCIVLKTFGLPLSAADEVEIRSSPGFNAASFGDIQYSTVEAPNDKMSFVLLNPSFECRAGHLFSNHQCGNDRFIPMGNDELLLSQSSVQELFIEDIAALINSARFAQSTAMINLARRIEILENLGFARDRLSRLVDTLSAGEILKLIVAKLIFIGTKDFSINLDSVFDLLDSGEQRTLISHLVRAGVQLEGQLGERVYSAPLLSSSVPAKSVNPISCGPYSSEIFDFPSITLRRGAVNLLIGPSDAGKETLLGFISSDKSVAAFSSKIFYLPLLGWPENERVVDALGFSKGIAKLFAGTLSARLSGISERDFVLDRSSNYCEKCLDIRLAGGVAALGMSGCADCGGRVFIGQPGRLDFGGLVCGDLMVTPLNKAEQFLSGNRKFAAILSIVQELNLGHLKLATPLSDLNDWEVHLLNISRFFGEIDGHKGESLLLLEHPFLGCPEQFKVRLRACIQRYAAMNNTVVVIDNSDSFHDAPVNVISLKRGSTERERVLIKVAT